MVLTNIFRLDGYEHLRWTILEPEAAGRPPGASGTLDLVLHAFLKLHNLGHLTAWTLRRDSGPRDENAQEPPCPLRLWHFRTPSTVPDQVLNKELLGLLPNFRVADSGTWTPQSRQPGVTHALSLAIGKKVERAFGKVSYHRFGRVYVRVGGRDTASEGPLLACELRLLSSSASLFLQAHVSSRNVRLLESSDFTARQPLSVICSPSGERASLLGTCPSELVDRLTEPPRNSTAPERSDPPAPSEPDGNSRKPRRSKARRMKHAPRSAPTALHVDVEVEASVGRLEGFDRQHSAEHGVEDQAGGETRNETGEDCEQGGQDPSTTLPEGMNGNGQTDGSFPERPSMLKRNGGKEHANRFCTRGRITDGRNMEDQTSDGRDPDARTLKSRERLILLRDRVLVPLPDLGQCAVQLRFNMGWAGLGVTGMGADLGGSGGLGRFSLVGLSTTVEESEDESSSSESDASVDTHAADEAAQRESQEAGVTSEVAGHKRGRSEDVGDVNAPLPKMRKLKEEQQDLKAFAPLDEEGGAGGGDTWWADDGLDVGLLADFADFGDAFGDSGGFGEVPGSSPKARSREASQPLSGPSRNVSSSTSMGLHSAGHVALQDGTPSSATATEADPEEPFTVLLDEFLSQPAEAAVQGRGGFVGSKAAPPLRSKGGSAKGKPSGGVPAEKDDRVWFPPDRWAAKVSLPAQSETSGEEVTRVAYKPEEKMVDFVRAVLGQGSGAAYEALPPGTPGLVEEAAQEVQLRGEYPTVRKARKGVPSSAKQAGGALEVLEDRGRDAGDEVKAGERGLQSAVEGEGHVKEHQGSGKSGLGKPEPFSERNASLTSVIATDLLLLRREAVKLIEAQAVIPPGEGGIQTGAETGANASGESGRDSDLSGPGVVAGLRPEPILELLEGGVSFGGLRKSRRDSRVCKQRPLSPLLLQQAIGGRVDFRTGPLEEAVEMGAGTVSAVTVAGVLTADVAVAFRDALGGDCVSGPLTVQELCQDNHSGGSVSGGLQPPAMQIGSPAIEHPVTPPQLWAITLSPLGGVGGALKVTPPLENVDAAGAETTQTESARIRELAPPQILVGYQEDWLRIPQGVLKQWEKAPLEPYAALKPVSYTVFCPAAADLIPLCVRYLRDLGSVYEACQLGSHVAGPLPQDLATPSAPGIIPVVLDPDRTAGIAGGSSSAGIDLVEKFVERIRKIAARLGFGSGNRQESTEGTDEACLVVYVVLPLCTEDQARSVAAQLAGLFWASENIDPTVRNGMPSVSHHPISLADTRLTLQLIPESELRRTWYRPGATDRFKRVAFQVYLKARRTTRKLPHRAPGLEGVQPTQMLGGSGEGSTGSGSGHLLFEPLVVLAEPPAFCPVDLARQSEEREVGELEAGEHAPESGMPLHCCYAWANHERTLVSVWTDGAGELLDAYVIEESRDESHAEGGKAPHSTGHLGSGLGGDNGLGASLLGVTQRAESIPQEQRLRVADRSDPYSHHRSEGLLHGILDQCAQLQALAAAALPEGDPPPSCHVIISRFGGMPASESDAWSRVLGSPRQHDVARGLTQILPVLDPARQSAPDVNHPGLGNLSARGAGLRHGRSFSLELAGDPLDLERFASLEQQCLSPASPGMVHSPFGTRSGGISDRAFLSPPERAREEPRGSVTSVTVMTMEEERSCQLLHGADERQGCDNFMSASISARSLPHSRNDHLIIPANPLHRLADCVGTDDGPDEPLATSVACGYLVGDVAPADDDVSFGTLAAKDDWPATLRFDLISHFASSGDNVHMPVLQETATQAITLLESIIVGFHALSWLNANHRDCRRSLLPMHAAMAEEVVKSIGG